MLYILRIAHNYIKRLRETTTNNSSNGFEILDNAAKDISNTLSRSGSPIDSSTREFMESRFGYDFSNIKIHNDDNAIESAKSINALAYTLGNDIAFGRGQYQPNTNEGKKLLAHELAHVLQQYDTMVPLIQRQEYDAGTLTDAAVEPLPGGVTTPPPEIAPPAKLEGHAETEFEHPAPNFVAYDGNQLLIFRKGKLVKSVRAVSGNPGREEYEKDVGPIPDGKYLLSPNIVRGVVNKLQQGTCGALGIESGIQEIRSTDNSPCADPPNHYCTVSCPTSDHPAQKCFTPMDCWGSLRIRIQGSKTVETPTGEKVQRDFFYIRGGNNDVPVTSGCIKIFDNSVFAEL